MGSAGPRRPLGHGRDPPGDRLRGARHGRAGHGGLDVAGSGAAEVAARLFRSDAGRALATLIRLLGDIELAEEALQDAFAIALDRWERDGVPANPFAWIVSTARNRAVDRVRRQSRLTDKTRLLMPDVGHHHDDALDPVDDRVDSAVPDDRLRLIFTCCHPALSIEAQVALTLRLLGGLTTTEVARAFLVSESTVAQRLVRAKSKVRRAGIPYRVPSGPELPARLDAVLTCVYLIFNEGYAATSADTLVRQELCADAIRLGRLVHELMPDQAEAAGLLGLMLLQDARRAARVDARGQLVLLDEQDRSSWDLGQIAEGVRLTTRALAVAPAEPGPYTLQAAIAAEHTRPATGTDTDWARIAALYERLLQVDPSPVVALNHGVAVAMAHGPEQGLAILDGIAGLDHYHQLHAARADLLRRLGRRDPAADAYRRALALATQPTERQFLARRLADLTSP